MINNVTLMGRLTAEPELKTTQSGKSVLSFCIAVERDFKQGDERQADFINIVAWNKTAEFINTYFRKGDMIAVVGKGHEDYQILKGGVKIHFDEKEVVSEILGRIKNENRL